MRMLSNWKQRLVAGMLIQSLLWLTACGAGGGGATSLATAQTGMVTGQVVSASDNAAVAGATVSTTAGATTSASDGSFTVAAGVGDRTVVHVEATGFAEAFPVARVTAGQTTTLGVKLLAVGVTTPMTITTGGTVTVPNSNAQVDLPANGLVPKNGGAVAGTVNVTVTPINPAVDPNLMPGDFNGVSAGGGAAEPIESFGAMVIDIRDNAGTRYNLAAGKTSTIRIPLGTLSATPPATIPLWFFDETTGLWKEEGTATLQGVAPNQYYEGTVAHFSTWNADRKLERVFVSGCVRDNNGQPVANVVVQTDGIDYSGRATVFSAADGTFKVAMRLNSTATLGLFEYDRQSFTYTAVSNTVNVGPSAVDFTLPNCIVKQPGVLTITSTLPPGNVGAAYSQTLAASGGIPGYVWSLNAGSNPLPAGLTLDATGVISGTPTTAGSTIITVKVTDSAGGTATKELNLTISPPGVGPVTITSSSPLPDGTVGVAYNVTLATSGGSGSFSWSIFCNALPAGLTLNSSTGRISGTPTASGTFVVCVQVRDNAPPQLGAIKTFSITINSASPGGSGGGVGSGGGGGTLTVSNAPASVGGTFVASANSAQTQTRVTGTSIAIGWAEDFSTTLTHIESLGVGFDEPTGITTVTFSAIDGGTTGMSWSCLGLINNLCSGVTVNRTAGTATFTNTVLTGLVNTATSITLNGTLNFTPF